MKADERRWSKCHPSLVIYVLLTATAAAQVPKPAGAPAAAQAQAAQDPLGRTTPRGAVLGFLNAAHKGDDKLASLYLNTRLRGEAAVTLSRQLAVVLDRRLPAKLQQLSDSPEGSLVDPLNPKRDLVGTIQGVNGGVEIFVERVDRGKLGTVWLFADETLKEIPELYAEAGSVAVDNWFPGYLVNNRLAGIPLSEWLVLFIGIPLIYLGTVLLNRFLGQAVGRCARFLLRRPELPDPEVLVRPVRLTIAAVIILSLKRRVGLTLMARQFGTNVGAVMLIASCVWLLILCNSKWEDYLRRRLERQKNFGASSVLRLGRRAVDVLVIFAGLLIILKYFRLNITAALAGLGVGGIAVALAAQKTLENVIGGISIVMDRVIRMGDFIKVADTVGTVEAIGLRSIRIRTPDRTVVSIPNGQIANVTLENFSRDKFWLHHFVGLRYDASAAQISSVVKGFEELLLQHALIEQTSVRVRFLRFGTTSLDVEIFAYILARDYLHFLEVQNELLLRLMAIVQTAGTQIALQTPILSTPAVQSVSAANVPASMSAARANGKRPRKRIPRNSTEDGSTPAAHRSATS